MSWLRQRFKDLVTLVPVLIETRLNSVCTGRASGTRNSGHELWHTESWLQPVAHGIVAAGS